jgi:hypothetical protein
MSILLFSLLATIFSLLLTLIAFAKDTVSWNSSEKKQFDDIVVKNEIVYQSNLFSVISFDKKGNLIYQYANNNEDFRTHIISWGKLFRICPIFSPVFVLGWGDIFGSF